MDSDDENVTENVKVLMYTSQGQTPKDRRKIRNKYQELIGDARKEKENEELNTDIIIQNMDQADELFKNVSTPQEAVYDAKLVTIHSEIAKKHAYKIQVESPFNSIAFLRKLAFKLNGTGSDSDFNLDKDAWSELGDRVFHMFNMTPKLNFIQGTFPEAGRSRPYHRHITENDKSEASAKVITSSARPRSTDKTCAEIQRIKKILCKEYKKNGGNSPQLFPEKDFHCQCPDDRKHCSPQNFTAKCMPVCYFRFTVDPNSFSRTIENMFHLSFLVKEGEVCISMDSNELPVIEPFLPEGTTADTETSQSVLTINRDKWKQLIEVFEITKPSIPPSRFLTHYVSSD